MLFLQHIAQPKTLQDPDENISFKHPILMELPFVAWIQEDNSRRFNYAPYAILLEILANTEEEDWTQWDFDALFLATGKIVKAYGMFTQ